MDSGVTINTKTKETSTYQATPALMPVSAVAADTVIHLIEACEETLSTITSAYPVSERDTWEIQRQEALAWQADNAAYIPFINALATARGISVAEHASRILIKAEAYQVAAAAAIGKRQRLEDNLNTIVADAALTDDEKRTAISAVIW